MVFNLGGPEIPEIECDIVCLDVHLSFWIETVIPNRFSVRPLIQVQNNSLEPRREARLACAGKEAVRTGAVVHHSITAR